MSSFTPAEDQFHVSSSYPTPAGYEPWVIRNDYPSVSEESGLGPLPGPGELPLGKRDAPWLNIDFRKDPKSYLEVIKQYCFEGNTDKEFVVQKNKVRDWYHAPWLHAYDSGREPLHGLTFERATPPRELASTQTRYLQNWACAYYNSTAASVFGQVWKDPNNPQWEQNLLFPQGSLIFKVLMNDATDEEVPTMRGSPTWNAITAKTNPGAEPRGGDRNTEPSPVRLVQMDVLVSDARAPIGWIFGTFIYDGRDFNPGLRESPAQQWERLIPIGLQWGNDPELNQEAVERGEKPKELWLNRDAEALREGLKGGRPSWGWNGRMNGPADNFISACASCHSVAQKKTDGSRPTSIVPPKPNKNPSSGQWVPRDDKETMRWFRNIPAGQPFDQAAISADYSLQLMMGYENFKKWQSSQVSFMQPIMGGGYSVERMAMVAMSDSFPYDRQLSGRPIAAGPDLSYD